MLAKLVNVIVIIYSADSDVFLLLLQHHYTIVCHRLYMKLVSGYVDITGIRTKLGDKYARALLSMHALTGCDTTGKFQGISKELWFRRLLQSEMENHQLMRWSIFSTGHVQRVFHSLNICTDILESFHRRKQNLNCST